MWQPRTSRVANQRADNRRTRWGRFIAGLIILLVITGLIWAVIVARGAGMETSAIWLDMVHEQSAVTLPPSQA